MEQMSTEGLEVVAIDFDSNETPESVKLTHPALFIERNTYKCILGPDERTGILGSGTTPAAALAEFDQNYKYRLEHPIVGDPVSEFILQRHI